MDSGPWRMVPTRRVSVTPEITPRIRLRYSSRTRPNCVMYGPLCLIGLGKPNSAGNELPRLTLYLVRCAEAFTYCDCRNLTSKAQAHENDYRRSDSHA